MGPIQSFLTMSFRHHQTGHRPSRTTFFGVTALNLSKMLMLTVLAFIVQGSDQIVKEETVVNFTEGGRIRQGRVIGVNTINDSVRVEYSDEEGRTWKRWFPRSTINPVAESETEVESEIPTDDSTIPEVGPVMPILWRTPSCLESEAATKRKGLKARCPKNAYEEGTARAIRPCPNRECRGGYLPDTVGVKCTGRRGIGFVRLGA